jgi:hypothetical protein
VPKICLNNNLNLHPFPHKIKLNCIHRKSDTTLIKCINALEKGNVSDEDVAFINSLSRGNLITKLFHGVKIKPGRCKDNWAKSTQRFYGLSWCKEPCDNAIINFNNLASFLPPDF